MTKYVKYISSDHYGAPQMKGDRWGYCVEMLRACLVTGFNERTDLIKFEVLTPETIKFTFGSNHMYVENQTIKVSDISYPELNGDALILSKTNTEVTVKSYNDLTGLVGQVQTVTAKARVAPLGFIEKFKDVNRSVFTTDEEKAYLYIDDTKPDNWSDTGTYTLLICPLVYMTDKMTDIDTPGKYIYPYTSSGPNDYKRRGWTDSSNRARNGLMQFLSYGMSNANGNTVAQRATPISWTIIGNGRMFYFLPALYFNSSYYYPIFGFGKYESSNTIRDIPYVLLGNGYCASTNAAGVYYYNRLIAGSFKAFTTNTGSLSMSEFISYDNTGRSNNAVLKSDNRTRELYFSPGYYPTSSLSDTTGLISGSNPVYQYPDTNTSKFITSRIRMNTSSKDLGKMSGLLWIFTGAPINFVHGTIYKYKTNSKDKLLYCYNNDLGQTINSTAYTKFIYMISLDYTEWKNYE